MRPPHTLEERVQLGKLNISNDNAIATVQRQNGIDDTCARGFVQHMMLYMCSANETVVG